MTAAELERALTDACRCIYESSQDGDCDHYRRAVAAYRALLPVPREPDLADCE